MMSLYDMVGEMLFIFLATLLHAKYISRLIVYFLSSFAAETTPSSDIFFSPKCLMYCVISTLSSKDMFSAFILSASIVSSTASPAFKDLESIRKMVEFTEEFTLQKSFDSSFYFSFNQPSSIIMTANLLDSNLFNSTFHN